MGGKINEVVAQWCAGEAAEYSCDTHSSSVRVLAGPVPVALARDLEALARLHQHDLGCMVGELLTAAICEAMASLPPAVNAALDAAKATSARADAEAEQEALQWDLGRT